VQVRDVGKKLVSMKRTMYKTGTRCVRGQDISVSIATGYELDDRGIGVRIPVVSRIFQTGSGVHPAYYPMGTGDSFTEDKAARA
jgi:hypothetical protein